MPINLTRARDRVALLVLVDACSITRDTQGAQDDTLDATTGLLTRPVGDTTTVYAGPCAVFTPTSGRQTDSGGDVVAVDRKTVRLPWDAPAPRPGDLVTITTSADPSLVGRQFRVTDVSASTILVMRSVTVEDAAPLPA